MIASTPITCITEGPLTALIVALERGGFDPRRKGPGGYESRCPGHGGSRHNLSVDLGDDGRALICCHHEPSCSAEAVVTALGLTMVDLFPQNPLRNGNGHADPVRAKTRNQPRVYPAFKAVTEALERIIGRPHSKGWSYRDADRKPVAAVLRFDDDSPGGKTFRPVAKVEGGWILKDPPGIWPLYRLPEIVDKPRIFIVEGEKCADMLAERGLDSTTTAHGAKSPHKTDLGPLAGKDVVILPDNDEPGERYAISLCKQFSKLDPQPRIKIIRLPLREEGDDVEQFFGEGGTAEQILAMVHKAQEWRISPRPSTERDPVESTKSTGFDADEPRPKEPYIEKDGFLYGRDGKGNLIPLANFTARIAENVIRYEGVKEEVIYRIIATHADGMTKEIKVPSDKYPVMTWTFDLGSQYAIEPGRDAKDKVRHAIQVMSQEAGVKFVREYTSLGWVEHGGEWIYLHAGGALGANGPSDAVRTDIPSVLARYNLPGPPDNSSAIRDVVLASLRVWDLADTGRPASRALAAVLATVPWRAVLNPSDFSVHLGGTSGNRKTSIARVLYQFFSDSVPDRNSSLPASWMDTPNALQRLAFDCCCCILPIDDLKTDTQIKTAETVIQAQGNGQNRARMNRDQSLQKSLPPRCTIVSTGEIDPQSLSTRGRILMVELGREDVDIEALGRLQAYGARGVFAQVMSCYIRWLAPQLSQVREEFAQITATIASELDEMPGTHSRHGNIVAQLLAAYRIFLRFAQEVGAAGGEEAEEYFETARNALLELGGGQALHQQEAKPGRRFVEAVASALATTRYHLLNAGADEKLTLAGACGWQREQPAPDEPSGREHGWRIPGGSQCIGFIDEKLGLVFLDPQSAPRAAKEMLDRLGNAPQSYANLGRELMNEGLVEIGIEKTTKRAAKKKRIHGHGTKRYYWIKTADLFESPDVPTVPNGDVEIAGGGNDDVPF